MRRIVRTAMLLLLVAVTSSSASAQDVLEWPCERAFVDIRGSTAPQDTFAVSLFARGTHAYVAVAYFDEQLGLLGRSMFGFYPESLTKGLVSAFGLPMPASVNLSGSDATPSLSATILVNGHHYQDVLQRKREWNPREYHLIARDSVELLADVAGALGLALPGSKEALLPTTYLREIVNLEGRSTRVDECATPPPPGAPPPTRPSPPAVLP